MSGLVVLFKHAAMMLQDVGSDHFVIWWEALINNGAFSRISITSVVPVCSLKTEAQPCVERRKKLKLLLPFGTVPLFGVNMNPE